MKYFGKIFVEFWNGDTWHLSAIWVHQYLLGRLWGYVGNSTADTRYYNYRHVPRKNVIW